MTTDNKDSSKNLRPSSKLTFGKKVDSIVTKTYVSSKSSTVVEVKQAAFARHSTQTVDTDNTKDHDSSDLNRKLNVLRRASSDENVKDLNQALGVTQLAELNNQLVQSELQSQRTLQDKLVNPGEQATHTKHRADLGSLEVPDDNLSISKKKLSNEVNIKNKLEENKKFKKSDILNMLETDNDTTKTRSLASIKRAREKEKRKSSTLQKQDKVYREVIIPEYIGVGELSQKMTEQASDVIRELMKLGIIASTNQSIDGDTAELIAGIFGHKVKRVQESDIENILIHEPDSVGNLTARAPIVTVMGHVDHGKTSLLDALKATDVVSSEAGGITQHIGAYKVSLKNGKSITFIDTPGHEAFTSMRIRGAQVTDIVVLVVAADDGIKAQTIEAISHAKAANVPIIVAINKIDKPDANIEKVKNELLAHNLVSEDLGGDVIVVPVSALHKTNLDKLEEAILLIAEMNALVANYEAVASGFVLESKIDKSKGVLATLLIQRGKLKIGDLILAGTTYGRIRKMSNDKGMDQGVALPSDPVEISGLNEAPSSGEKFHVISHEKQARDLIEYRLRKIKEKKTSLIKKVTLENLFAKASPNNVNKELSVIIKCDTHGSVDAISSSLQKFSNPEVSIRILHAAVGAISEADVTLATASSALIFGFNVRATNGASIMAEKNAIDVRYHSIIYSLLDEIKDLMSGMLSLIAKEEVTGRAEIREVFTISKVGKVAGSYVTKGFIKKDAGARLLRDNVVVYQGKIKTLKRFKEDAKEVRESFECGIVLHNYDDIRVGDVIEAFEITYTKQKL